jgi:hypothetical protein
LWKRWEESRSVTSNEGYEIQEIMTGAPGRGITTIDKVVNAVYADLEASHRIGDPVECDVLAPRELGDGAQIDKQKSFGFIDEAFD